MKLVLLHKENQILSVLMDESRKAADIGCFSLENLSIGRILVGRVKDIADNIKAVFVDIGEEQNAYLQMDDIGEHTIFTKKNGKKTICKGDELLVMINREPIKSKPVSVTTKISLSGKYAAVTADGKGGVYLSKKISDTAIKTAVSSHLPEEMKKRFSVILRTNSANAALEDVINEVKELYKSLSDIIDRSIFQPGLSVMFEPLPDWLMRVRDIRNEMLDEVVTDDEWIYGLLQKNSDALLDKKTQIRLYTDKMLPLIKACSIDRILREVLSEKVWMKSGGYLIIQPTEALTAIDVNSGKADKGHDSQKSAYKLNMEAAVEAARQIRLRNLSGIILIDFINLKDENLKSQLTSELSAILRNDPVTTVFMGLTKLELAEITRKKVRKPLYQTGIDIFLNKTLDN